MPRQETLLCPSGLTVIVRSRKTRDFDIISSDDPKRDDRYMETVVQQVLDRGVYGDSQFTPDGRLIINPSFLMGDYYAILLKHHQLNKPDKPFIKTFRCDGDECEYIEDMKIWLGDENSNGHKGKEDGIYRLRLRMLSEESAEQFQDKNLFSVEHNGKQIQFMLQNRKTYALFLKHAMPTRKDTTKEEKYTSMVASRIVSVEGEPENFNAIREWVGGQDEDDEDELTEKMDAIDCGVDYDLFPECPRCEELKLYEMLIDKDFFSRGRRKKRPPLQA